MTRQISKWLLVACATLVAACNADTSVLAPSAPAPTSVAVGAPPRSDVQPIVARDQAGPQGVAVSAGQQSQTRGRGRYAMAAN